MSIHRYDINLDPDNRCDCGGSFATEEAPDSRGDYVRYADHVASHAFDTEVERARFEVTYSTDCDGNIKYHPGVGYYWDDVKYRDFAERKQTAWYYWKQCAQSRVIA